MKARPWRVVVMRCHEHVSKSSGRCPLRRCDVGMFPREPSGGQLSVSDIAAHFPSYQQMTKDVVEVNPEFSGRCASLSAGELDAARVRFGPHANTGILIYMNALAARAFESNAAAYPLTP